MLTLWRRFSKRKPENDPEAGFSVLELSIALVIASIVVASAGDSLISLSNAESHNNSSVQQEQSASQVMAQIERDIRSATTVSFPSGVSPSSEVQLAVANADGTTTNVLWVYNPTTKTFSREVQSQGSFAPSGYSISNVSNGATPVFTYFTDSAPTAAMSSSSASEIASIAECATGVNIQVNVTAGSNGASGFQESAEVALTQRLEVLTAPGNGLCGSSS